MDKCISNTAPEISLVLLVYSVCLLCKPSRHFLFLKCCRLSQPFAETAKSLLPGRSFSPSPLLILMKRWLRPRCIMERRCSAQLLETPRVNLSRPGNVLTVSGERALLVCFGKPHSCIYFQGFGGKRSRRLFQLIKTLTSQGPEDRQECVC